jgi:hypothetical protein
MSARISVRTSPPAREIPVRITVVAPPTGVAIEIQRGRDALLPPARVTNDSITFDFHLRLGDSPGGGPNFLGEFAQGPPSARFVYVNSGKRAGQPGSSWDRRAKVPLTSISSALVEATLRRPGVVLAARIAGKARDGGPMCATVPLLGDGWVVEKSGSLPR